MAALRGWVIAEHAVPRFLGKAFASARYLPLVAVIPILLVVAYLALWGDLHYPNTFNSGDEIILDHFIRDSHGDYGVFIMFGFMFGVLGLGILKFWKGLNASAIVPATRSGLSIIQSLIRAVIETLKHANFTRCETSRSAYWAHLGIMYGCIALIGATGITFVLHYGMGWHSPWGIFSVTKVLGTIGTVLVMAGTGIALYKRLANDPTSGKSSYLDWFLLLLLILVTLSGFATWMLRIAELEAATYWAYLVHIVLFFEFFIYLPFSKAAHIFYRLTAMTWSHYTGRGL